jgi:hypothetical protein
MAFHVEGSVQPTFSGTPKMVITDTGDVGVGVSSSLGAKLHVAGDLKLDTIDSVSNNTNFLVSDGGVIKISSGGGPTGPTGATGADGFVGSNGATGPAGPTGPAGATSTARGPTGGNSWITASGDPSASNTTGAVNGDLYLDTSDGQVYQLENGSWNYKTDLTGDQGSVGPTGVQGSIGPQGPTGAVGAAGPTGADSTVVGPTGPQGPAGPTGADGVLGGTGATGPIGPTGAQGVQGDTGATGNDGATGEGDKYATSSSDTETIATGSVTFTVAAGLSYSVGQSAIAAYNASNKMEGDVTSYSGTSLIINVTSTTGSGSHSSWDINLSGAAGPKGEDGTDGSVGPTGPQGPVGPTGAAGTNGATGAAGPTGAAGAVGAAGATGVAGAAGAVGATGAQGPKGDDGPQGAQGPRGDDGPQGPVGPRGPNGATGAAGPTGAAGAAGAAGATGVAGAAGSDGDKGDKGDKGDQGDRGPTGLVDNPSEIDDAVVKLLGYKDATNTAYKVDAARTKTFLGLGSAAYTASGSYATSAQGGLASTAVQPADTFEIGRTSIAHNRTKAPNYSSSTTYSVGKKVFYNNLTWLKINSAASGQTPSTSNTSHWEVSIDLTLDSVNINGNALTATAATKLQTARTIFGTDFDGTQNIVTVSGAIQSSASTSSWHKLNSIQPYDAGNQTFTTTTLGGNTPNLYYKIGSKVGGRGYTTDDPMYGEILAHRVVSKEIDHPSDERIKTDIESTNVGLDLIRLLDVKTFKYKKIYLQETPRKRIGVIAQELEQALSDIGVTTEEYGLMGYRGHDEGVENGLKFVNINSLLFVALNAIKQLDAKVSELEKKLEE